jgi:hypothetical protein
MTADFADDVDDASDSDGQFSYDEAEAPVFDAVLRFLKSATYDEKRGIVAAHPLLLTPEAASMMQRMAEAHRRVGDSEAAAVTIAWVEFLEHCREHSFDYAVARSAMNELFVGLPENPGVWGKYLRSVAQRDVRLHSRDADAAVGDFIEMIRDDDVEPLIAPLEGLRTMLKHGRRTS